MLCLDGVPIIRDDEEPFLSYSYSKGHSLLGRRPQLIARLTAPCSKYWQADKNKIKSSVETTTAKQLTSDYVATSCYVYIHSEE